MNITKSFLYLKNGMIGNAYNNIMRGQYFEINKLEVMQVDLVNTLISYLCNNDGFYKNRMVVNRIDKLRDLEQFSITTKEDIKNNYSMFFAYCKGKFVESSTGGSTGEPLKYKMSKKCNQMGRALLYRGRSNAGYNPGDKLFVIAGGSLVGKKSVKNTMRDAFLNYHSVSVFGLSESKLAKEVKYLKDKKPPYLFGYVSSLVMLAEFIANRNTDLSYSPRALFTTSEKLFPKQRVFLEDIFHTKVFDNYGLNDGGVSAYECEQHSGMHIDYERSILEVVDENGRQITEGYGRIIATSLLNYDFPFFRYDTGDYGSITYKKCSCGRTTPRLLSIDGRVTDYLKVKGIYIGSPVLTVLMGKLDQLDSYQIIQDSQDTITFKLVYRRDDNDYKNYCKKYIEKAIFNIITGVNIYIIFLKEYGDLNIENKHKIIINRCM